MPNDVSGNLAARPSLLSNPPGSGENHPTPSGQATNLTHGQANDDQRAEHSKPAQQAIPGQKRPFCLISSDAAVARLPLQDFPSNIKHEIVQSLQKDLKAMGRLAQTCTDWNQRLKPELAYQKALKDIQSVNSLESFHQALEAVEEYDSDPNQINQPNASLTETESANLSGLSHFQEKFDGCRREKLLTELGKKALTLAETMDHERVIDLIDLIMESWLVAARQGPDQDQQYQASTALKTCIDTWQYLIEYGPDIMTELPIETESLFKFANNAGVEGLQILHQHVPLMKKIVPKATTEQFIALAKLPPSVLKPLLDILSRDNSAIDLNEINHLFAKILHDNIAMV